jgi:hypothetical protein
MRTRIILVLAAAATAVTLLSTGALAGATHRASQATTSKERRALFAVMTGRKEVDQTTGKRGAGDPDGRGSFTATIDGTSLCFGITVTNLDQPVAAHIHKARPNKNGGIVVPLTAPTAGDPGASSGCVTIAPDLAAAILKNPHRYYANVHTTTFPGGAVRGQLFGKTR